MKGFLCIRKFAHCKASFLITLRQLLFRTLIGVGANLLIVNVRRNIRRIGEKASQISRLELLLFGFLSKRRNLFADAVIKGARGIVLDSLDFPCKRNRYAVSILVPAGCLCGLEGNTLLCGTLHHLVLPVRKINSPEALQKGRIPKFLRGKQSLFCFLPEGFHAVFLGFPERNDSARTLPSLHARGKNIRCSAERAELDDFILRTLDFSAAGRAGENRYVIVFIGLCGFFVMIFRHVDGRVAIITLKSLSIDVKAKPGSAVRTGKHRHLPLFILLFLPAPV